MQREHEAVLERLLALILDHVQLVKAGVRRWQPLLRPVRLVDLEALRAPDALQWSSDTPQQTVQLLNAHRLPLQHPKKGTTATHPCAPPPTTACLKDEGIMQALAQALIRAAHLQGLEAIQGHL